MAPTLLFPPYFDVNLREQNQRSSIDRAVGTSYKCFQQPLFGAFLLKEVFFGNTNSGP
jgi:hypothetical protein